MVADSLQVTEFVVDALTFTEAEPWLRSQLLIVENRPTVAAVVLFADEPQINSVTSKYGQNGNLNRTNPMKKSHLLRGKFPPLRPGGAGWTSVRIIKTAPGGKQPPRRSPSVRGGGGFSGGGKMMWRRQ